MKGSSTSKLQARRCTASYRQKIRVVWASGKLAATARMSLIPWSMKNVVAANGCGRCGGTWRSGSLTRQYEDVV